MSRDQHIEIAKWLSGSLLLRPKRSIGQRLFSSPRKNLNFSNERFND